MNIVVLAGGLSPERDVSLSSGSLIANSLIRSGHRVLLADVYRGLDFLPEDLSELFHTTPDYRHVIPETVPDLEAVKAENGGREALIGAHILEVCAFADVVFLALHGDMGENGQLQATLDVAGIRYTGSGYIGSLLAMDKDIAKRLVRAAGVPTPDWIYAEASEEACLVACRKLGLPAVVKPCSCGSSVGVSIVEDEAALSRAIEAARVYEGRLLIEKKITGREFSVGILEGQVLPAIEIILDEGFYDYKNKYQGKTREVCPAPLAECEAARLAAWAKMAFEALRLEGYARIDFLMDEGGDFYFLEANTLPGMTPTSLLPQEAAAVGIGYDELCHRIAMLGYRKTGTEY